LLIFNWPEVVARKRECVEKQSKDTCPLRGASACGHGDVFTHAKALVKELESHVKDCERARALCVNPRCKSMRDEPRATVRRAW
jgi:hypothetical protein